MTPSYDPGAIAVVRKMAADGSLRALLKASHVSQAELAAGLGVHETTVGKWLDGTRHPRPEVAMRLGDVITTLSQISTEDP